MLKSILEKGEVIIDLRNSPLPLTITLLSKGACRQLELSPIDDVNFFSPVLDATTDNMLVLSISTPVVTLRITGEIGDTIIIRE